MVTLDKRVDSYIQKSADYAQPILIHLRKLVHLGCPDTIETIKWGFPHFDYKGMFCSMAAFKNHCAFTFWKAKLLSDSVSLGKNNAEAMGHMGQIKSLSDLPSDKNFISLVKEAVKLNNDGIKLPARQSRTTNTPLEIPTFISISLSKNKSAMEVFNKFSSSHKREYIQWITEAKSEETRNKRIATMIEWLIEGKSRNWKYETKKER